jgi:aminoglycoside 3-N-acetyltransferase
MSKNIIESTTKPNTVESILNDLIALGVESDDTLLVHSSMSSLGWVCGGEQSVIMALQEAVNEGTLVMPAHSDDWSDPAKWERPPVPKEWVQIIYDNMPAYNKDITPTSNMGRVAELFRTLPNTIRSNHPQVSFAAYGEMADEITSNHAISPMFGMNSPIGRMCKMDAKVLLLGVGYNKCTSFHLAETQIENMPKECTGAAIIEDGKRVWKWFDDFDYDSDDFAALGNEFENETCVQKSKIGNADCRLFSMQAGVDFAKKWIMENRNLQ